ncbi:MAG: hypothetical protein ABIQ78_11070 [Dokdonella sp.]
MLNPVLRTSLLIWFVCAVTSVPVHAADALFRSSFENSICNSGGVDNEIEPNDTFIISNVLALTNGNDLVCGALPGGVDIDVFKFPLGSTQALIVEIIVADGSPCVAELSAPARITLYDSSLAQIATDNNGGVGCASLDGITNPVLQMLPAGNYYVKVEPTNNVYVPAYTLRISAF